MQLDAEVSGGRLRITWSYSAGLHRPETIERLAHDCLDEIRRLVDSKLGFGVTAADLAIVARDLETPDLSGIEAVYPLTPMQQGILFHSRLAAERGRA